MDSTVKTTWLPDLLYAGGRFCRDVGLACDAAGRVVSLVPAAELAAPSGRVVRLPGRALLPGLVNAHSHAFQRVIRGRTEHRSSARDSFWTWREAMYSASNRLSPEDLYDASRMAFLEMALSGITSVGEFHYLHRTPTGAPYDDPNLLAKQVVAAARDVGIRIALLRVAYARSGFNKPPDERQKRFIEPDPETFVRHAEDLRSSLAAQDGGVGGEATAGAGQGAAAGAWAGVAPHSVRAVTVEYLREAAAYASARSLPVHMHVSEQPAEVSACLEETGRTPVLLLHEEGVLGPLFTGVHAVHVTPEEVRALASAGATVCACPTTERNLGDGVVPADVFFAAGVPVALGTDSHAQIDLLEDARELEYHLRLQRLERNVLAPGGGAGGDETERRSQEEGAGGGAPVVDVEMKAGGASRLSALAARLFECATARGAHSIGAPTGVLEPGRPADFFTVDLDDPSVAGAGEEDLLAGVVFSLARTAVREVFVGARPVVADGRHAAQEEVVRRFAALQRKLWGGKEK